MERGSGAEDSPSISLASITPKNMDKFLNKHSFSLNTLLRRLVEESTNSNFLWRVVLVFLFCMALLLGGFAWLLYGEVTTEPSIPVTPKHTQVTLSLDELRGVISFYQHKEDDFRSVRSSAPVPPLFNTESGMSISPNPDQSAEQVLPL